MTDVPSEDDHLAEATFDLVRQAARLVVKAKALVDALDDEEKYHGGLVRTESLRAKNELRLELSRWSK